MIYLNTYIKIDTVITPFLLIPFLEKEINVSIINLCNKTPINGDGKEIANAQIIFNWFNVGPMINDINNPNNIKPIDQYPLI
jgi:hypothetical protein